MVVHRRGAEEHSFYFAWSGPEVGETAESKGNELYTASCYPPQDTADHYWSREYVSSPILHAREYGW